MRVITKQYTGFYEYLAAGLWKVERKILSQNGKNKKRKRNKDRNGISLVHLVTGRELYLFLTSDLPVTVYVITITP